MEEGSFLTAHVSQRMPKKKNVVSLGRIVLFHVIHTFDILSTRSKYTHKCVAGEVSEGRDIAELMRGVLVVEDTFNRK